MRVLWDIRSASIEKGDASAVKTLIRGAPMDWSVGFGMSGWGNIMMAGSSQA